MDQRLPRGFSGVGVAAKIKPSGRKDLALVVSDKPAVVAGVTTTNKFVAAPVIYSRRVLESGRRVRALVVNAGNANAGTGEAGLRDAEAMAVFCAREIGCESDEVLVSSTGIIGHRLPMGSVEKGISDAAGRIASEGDLFGVAETIMTTDTFPKRVWAESGDARIFGIAKGAGMIHPNMATMLGFVFTDTDISRDDLQPMVSRIAERTFNSISIDNDTSTNDMLLVFANGESGTKAPDDFEAKLEGVCRELALKIVEDGEGATKIITIEVTGARTDAEAKTAGETVATSMLFKTAMHGEDPNWGRILAALGRSGANLDPANVRVSLCGTVLFENGLPVNVDLEALRREMKSREIRVSADLGSGSGAWTVYTTDLSREYIAINADYTT